METPSNFTFVETGIPTSRRGTTRGSTARSLIRSHAMQQVWEQRRLQRAQDADGANFEIVFENEKLKDSNKAKPHPRRRPLETLPDQGAAKSVKNIPGRKSTRSAPGKGNPKSTTTRKYARKDGRGGNAQEGENTKNGRSLPSSALQANCRGISYGGNLDTSWSSSTSPSPPTLGMGLMDPFDACAVPLGPKESRYMSHYFQALSWRFTMPKKTWLRFAIHDPGLLHGVLAIAAAHYSFATTRGLSNDAMYHHSKTINHVQQCLSDPRRRFSDAVIAAIGRMVICHLVFGSREQFATHMRAIQKCADARGGLDSLGMVGQLKYIIASCVGGAATIWWEDVPPELRYPYGPLDYPAINDVPGAQPHDPEWGCAFRELNKIGFISDKLLDIIEAMVALNSILDSRRTWDEQQQRTFGEQCNMLSLRLVYLKEEEAIARREMNVLDCMRECVRLAVHFYVSAFQRDVPLLSNLSIQTLHNLRDSLYMTDLETSWGGGRLGEVLLWVMIITASGCVRPQERTCAGAQLRKTATQLGVTQWLEVKKVCRRFLFLESAVEWKTWPLWKDYGPRSEDDMSPAQSDTSLLSTDERVVVVH